MMVRYAFNMVTTLITDWLKYTVMENGVLYVIMIILMITHLWLVQYVINWDITAMQNIAVYLMSTCMSYEYA